MQQMQVLATQDIIICSVTAPESNAVLQLQQIPGE
jgi:hypothetical protein